MADTPTTLVRLLGIVVIGGLLATAGMGLLPRDGSVTTLLLRGSVLVISYVVGLVSVNKIEAVVLRQ